MRQILLYRLIESLKSKQDQESEGVCLPQKQRWACKIRLDLCINSTIASNSHHYCPPHNTITITSCSDSIPRISRDRAIDQPESIPAILLCIPRISSWLSSGFGRNSTLWLLQVRRILAIPYHARASSNRRLTRFSMAITRWRRSCMPRTRRPRFASSTTC